MTEAVAVRAFRDAKTGKLHRKGERFECSPARLRALVAANAAMRTDTRDESETAEITASEAPDGAIKE